MVSCMKTPFLFRKIEQLQGDAPWGHILDAGTGPTSLRWVASLQSSRWTAVTAQPSMVASARGALPASPRDGDRILAGNWADENLLAGETFDTVLLDYFIGAIDAFVPYGQEALVERVVAQASGAVYVIGLEPYVPLVADEEVGRFVGDLGRLRDACQLLARDRPYREFPASWVRAVLQRAGLTVTHTKFYQIRYRSVFLEKQLRICESRVKGLGDPALAAAMTRHIGQVRREGERLIEKHDGLRYGKDYVMRAVRSVK